MITIPFIICLLGLLIWLIFTKWQKVADGWVARVGEILFVVGLFWTVASHAGKVAW
jgi:hypothetical protein